MGGHFNGARAMLHTRAAYIHEAQQKKERTLPRPYVSVPLQSACQADLVTPRSHSRTRAAFFHPAQCERRESYAICFVESYPKNLTLHLR